MTQSIYPKCNFCFLKLIPFPASHNSPLQSLPNFPHPTHQKCLSIKPTRATSPVVHWWGHGFPMLEVQVWSLVGKLRSCMPCGQKIKTHTKKQKQYFNKFNKDFKNGPHLKKKKPISCFKNLSPAHHCFYRSPSLHHTASEPRLKSPHPFPHSCQSNLEKGKSCICLSQLNLFSSFPSHLE